MKNEKMENEIFKIGALNLPAENFRYRAMIGVGGIGAGSFFALAGNHTLGREESRGGRFLDRRDYCKLHIIAHYVGTLLGPAFTTIPVGKVGDDDAGRQLQAEMAEAGLDMRYVERAPGEQTLFSFCFIYPDGSGGNLTTTDSACSLVDSAYVAKVEPEFKRFAGRGIALAAPEVPLATRNTLLQLATRHRFFRVASFTSEEIATPLAAEMITRTDLLAVNLDEAAAAVGLSTEGAAPAAIVEQSVDRLRRINPALQLSITAGKSGSWCWDGQALAHQPVIPVPIGSTAGAGDAHLSGLLVALTAGLPLADAEQLAALVAALAVTSPHTLSKAVNRATLQELAEQCGSAFSSAVCQLLHD